MKSSACLVASLSVLAAPFLSVATQQPAEPLPETRIVLRVSGKFIQGLVGTRFQRNEPIDTEVGGVAVTGTAHVTGEFRITLYESKTEGDFDLMGRGEVLTQLAATRRPVVVQTHGAAPFSLRQRIVHKGDLFIAQSLTIDVQNHFALDEIRPYRSSLLTGALKQRIARPFVRRGLTQGNHQANDEIRSRMTQELEIELDKLIVALNKIPPLVKQAYELIILENKPPTEGMRVYRAATKEHLLFSIGAPDQLIPNLPNLDKDKPAPLELWIAVDKNALTEERRKAILANWRLIAPYLRNQLQRRSPELVKEADEPLTRLLEEVQMHEVAGWHVLTFAPKIPLPAVGPP
jgi:hypothetical protein